MQDTTRLSEQSGLWFCYSVFAKNWSYPKLHTLTALTLFYLFCKSWFTQSTSSSTAAKDTDAKYNIRQYYAWVINGVWLGDSYFVTFFSLF